MNVKKIILTSTLLGFTLPSVAAVGALAVALKKSDREDRYSSGREVHTEFPGTSGCGCPFCQPSGQSVEKMS